LATARCTKGGKRWVFHWVQRVVLDSAPRKLFKSLVGRAGLEPATRPL
jgi:hypothetical protein